MWDCSVDVAGALDAMDSINAYEQFLEVEHLNQPSFQLLRLRQLIPDADTFGFIGDHREGMENRKVG
jgi:hypothetical protein